MAGKAKAKAAAKRTRAKSTRQTQPQGIDAAGSDVEQEARSGHGQGVDSPPAKSYATMEAMPEYYQGFAHPSADRYAIVKHEDEQDALDEGITGKWENARDGHYVVSVFDDAQADGDSGDDGEGDGEGDGDEDGE